MEVSYNGTEVQTLGGFAKHVQTIVLVDDDEVVRSVAVQLIKETGNEIIVCSSASEAISVFLKTGLGYFGCDSRPPSGWNVRSRYI